MSKITVITGDRGAGKSRFCRELLEKFQKEGHAPGGFISPAIYSEGVKTAFYTMDVRTGEQRLCGTRTGSGQGSIGCWQMDPAVLAWGNELMRNSTPCDELFIDELGPLEFERNEGYTAAFETLRRGEFDEALVVVRPECLDAFRAEFPVFSLREIREGDVSLD